MTACSPDASEPALSDAADLETAAIERGLVRDPGDAAIVGLYARDTDRVCVVPDGERHRIGVFVDYGDGLNCAAQGRAMRAGERLDVDLGADCSFEATYDGERIAFPPVLPPGCRSRCTGRASLAAVEVERLSDSLAEARAMRDVRGRLPCRGS